MKYDDIIDTLDILYSLDSEFKNKLVVAGGIVPYIVQKVKSSRLHGDIDLICSINDIEYIRNVIKNHNLYKYEMDSKMYFNSEYGFHFMINNIKVGIYPYFVSDALYQRSYDGTTKKAKTKKLNINIDEYINNEYEYKVMSLEVILKSKLIAFREKDRLDIDLICKHGINSELYSKIRIEDI